MKFFHTRIKARSGRNVNVHPTAIIEGEVILSDNVTIQENAKIIGPTFIGSKTVIGNNTLIRESSIGENCMIGFSSEIARSHIGNSCWFHNNYIGDSIIDDNVLMGAGAITANYKLDGRQIYSELKGKKVLTGRIKFGTVIGENSKVGVNATIMPGVKIGRNSIVGPSVILVRDLPDGKYSYLAKTSVLVKNNKNLSKSR